MSLCSGPEHHGFWKDDHAAQHAQHFHSHGELDGGGEKRLRENGPLDAAAAAGDGRSSAPAPALRHVEELHLDRLMSSRPRITGGTSSSWYTHELIGNRRPRSVSAIM